MSKTIFMGTTEVPAERSASEIVSLLVQAGARQIGMDYDKSGELTGLKFTLEVRGHGLQPFALPARIDPVFRIINGKRKAWEQDRSQIKTKDLQTAKRVAWRQLLRWAQAQIAMVQLGMVEAGEVFSPYLQGEDGKSLWERLISGSGQLALPPGPESNVTEFKNANSATPARKGHGVPDK